MKFGKRLGAEAGRGWQGAFLDYKACKRAISKDVVLEGKFLTLEWDWTWVLIYTVLFFSLCKNLCSVWGMFLRPLNPPMTPDSVKLSTCFEKLYCIICSRADGNRCCSFFCYGCSIWLTAMALWGAIFRKSLVHCRPIWECFWWRAESRASEDQRLLHREGGGVEGDHANNTLVVLSQPLCTSSAIRPWIPPQIVL